MNHYCTYFDRGFLIQGLALWRSLRARDPEAVLWVLALDAEVARVLGAFGESPLRVVPLAELEGTDPELVRAKENRSRVEYYFTLSPCWPLWLLRQHPEIERLTYLDTDLFFFASPEPIFAAMDDSRASVAITSHRLPPWLNHYRRHGVYNVGVLAFRNDRMGQSCLEDWRRECLAWCYDRLEGDRYADQKYLERWPERLGGALVVVDHAGVNLAPWNWAQYRLTRAAGGPAVSPDRAVLPQADAAAKDPLPVVVFHFARFRPTRGDRWWQSGQLDYGVMPSAWRHAIYTPYWRALRAARAELRRVDATVDFPRRAVRLNRAYWRGLPLRILFGGDWLRVGDRFFNLRAGLGRSSGRVIAWVRRLVRG